MHCFGWKQLVKISKFLIGFRKLNDGVDIIFRNMFKEEESLRNMLGKLLTNEKECLIPKVES